MTAAAPNVVSFDRQTPPANGGDPPQSIDVENALISATLGNPNLLEEVVDIVPNADAFCDPACRETYAAQLRLRQAGQHPNAISVADVLGRKGRIDGNDRHGNAFPVTRYWLTEMSHIEISQQFFAHALDYARTVYDRKVKRDAIIAGQQIAKVGTDPTISAEETVEVAEQLVYELKNQTGRLSSSDGKPTDALIRIAAAWDTGVNSAMPTGFYDLDGMFAGGLRGGDYVGIMAGPSTGKSAFAMKLCQSVSQLNQKPCVFFSLEMPQEQLLQRQISICSGVNFQKIRANKLDPDELAKCMKAVHQISNEMDVRMFGDVYTVSGIRSVLRRMGPPGTVGCAVVDYFQLMSAPGKSDNRAEELSRISRELKRLGKELDLAIVPLSQIDRNSLKKKNNKRPELHDARGSGQYENDADVVVGLYRDEVYNPDTVDRGIMEAIVLKQRNGPTGTVRLLYRAQNTEVLNLQQSGRMHL